MTNIKLFKIEAGTTTELAGSSHGLEKPLQNVFEANLHALLGVQFLASEYSTGRAHAGRIDTLGIDENGCPVIIEYKRAVSENVVNQGLYYLDWLLDHRAEFQLLVMEQQGKAAADKIDWSAPRLICVASDYKKFDEHAIRQINRNIDLVRYKKFGGELLVLELATTVSAASAPGKKVATGKKKGKKLFTDMSVSERIDEMTKEMRVLYEALTDIIMGLGDDVNQKTLKYHVAYKRIRNFATLVVQSQDLLLYLHIDPNTVSFEGGFSRDMRETNHWGTGDVEVRLANRADLEKAQPLIMRAFEE
jgi:predicted transport protein